MVFDIVSWLVFQLQGYNASAVLPLSSSDSVSQRRNWSLLVICSAGECSGDKNYFLLCWNEQLQEGYPPLCSGESCSLFEFESRGSPAVS